MQICFNIVSKLWLDNAAILVQNLEYYIQKNGMIFTQPDEKIYTESPEMLLITSM
jgi:hypothetical protein